METLNNESFETYKNNPIIAGYSWLLWLTIGFFGYLFLSRTKSVQSVDLIFYILIPVEFFILVSWNMNYFQVSKNHLRILKHYLFWVKKIYQFSEIQEIVLVENTKLGYGLKVVTTDFKNKTYYASALKNKTWLELKDKLESLNINVIDERRQT